MKKIKEIFKKFIEKIGNENSKNFGDQRMDCCDLNKKTPKK